MSMTPFRGRCMHCGHDHSAPQRDPIFGGHSYEASMLRDLLAVIHGDGGHYVAQHGLDKAIDDARAKLYATGAALAELKRCADHLASVTGCDARPGSDSAEIVRDARAVIAAARL